MLRRVIRWVATGIFALLILPIVTVNIEKLLGARHWDEFLLNWWPNMPDLNYLVSSCCLWASLGFSGGMAMALWIVKLWPERVRLEIIKAEYGISKESKDVTKTVNNLIDDNRLIFIVENQILGVHPDPGTRKTLTIEYKLNGKKMTKHFAERDWVIIPKKLTE